MCYISVTPLTHTLYMVVFVQSSLGRSHQHAHFIDKEGGIRTLKAGLTNDRAGTESSKSGTRGGLFTSGAS